MSTAHQNFPTYLFLKSGTFLFIVVLLIIKNDTITLAYVFKDRLHSSDGPRILSLQLTDETYLHYN